MFEGLGAMLLPPIAWVLHHQISYLLTYWVCENGGMFLYHIITLVLLGLAGLGAYLGWKSWKESGSGLKSEGGSVLDRSRFMGLSGMVLGVSFAVVIVAQWIPTFMLNPCIR
jgi:hypothetical protein